MKKIFFIAALLFGLSQSFAQFSFKPGLRSGLNFSHFTKGNNSYDYYGNNSGKIDFTSRTDFYLGFYGAMHLTKYYTLQPEINYSRQGATLNSESYNVNYLSLGVVNKFTFTDKFNVHLGPTIDFILSNGNNINPDSQVDLAFVLGAGYNFNKNFGIEARIKKGIIPVLDYSSSNHTNVVMSVGANYSFDLK